VASSTQCISTIYVLKDSQRQKGDAVFLGILDRLRVDDRSRREEDFAILRTRVIPPGGMQDINTDETLILYPRVKSKATYNEEQLHGTFAVGEIREYVAQDKDAAGNLLRPGSSSIDYIDRIRDMAPRILQLAVGAKVMLLRNVDVRKGWVNGSICVVDACNDSVVTVHLQV
jgi:hypothetical protein